jgi:hypothetical protein
MYCDAYISDDDEEVFTIEKMDIKNFSNTNKHTTEDVFLFIPDNKNHKSIILSKPIIDEPPIALTKN